MDRRVSKAGGVWTAHTKTERSFCVLIDTRKNSSTMRLVWTTSLPLFMVVALTMTTTFVNAFVVPTTTTTTNYYDNNNAARLLLSDEPKQQQPPQRLEPLFLAKKKKEEEEDTGDTIRKAEFVDSIVAKTGLSKKDANAALGAVLDTIEEGLVAGKKVTFVGFGTFKVTERSARVGRNPRTGEPLQIAASKTPSFSAGKSLKDKMNGK